MRYRTEVWLTERRAELKPQILYEGGDWDKAKEQFNFWSNEYRDYMDRISIRVLRT